MFLLKKAPDKLLNLIRILVRFFKSKVYSLLEMIVQFCIRITMKSTILSRAMEIILRPIPGLRLKLKNYALRTDLIQDNKGTTFKAHVGLMVMTPSTEKIFYELKDAIKNIRKASLQDT